MLPAKQTPTSFAKNPPAVLITLHIFSLLDRYPVYLLPHPSVTRRVQERMRTAVISRTGFVQAPIRPSSWTRQVRASSQGNTPGARSRQSLAMLVVD